MGHLGRTMNLNSGLRLPGHIIWNGRLRELALIFVYLALLFLPASAFSGKPGGGGGTTPIATSVAFGNIPQYAAPGAVIVIDGTTNPRGADGTVSIKDGAAELGVAEWYYNPSNGERRFRKSIQLTELGAHTIVAQYSGSATYAPSSASVAISIGRNTNNLSVRESTGALRVGMRAHLIVTVLGPYIPTYSVAAPTGTVAFKSGSQTLGVVPLDPSTRTAGFDFDVNSEGQLPITIEYSGDQGWAPSTATQTLNVAGQSSPPITYSVVPGGNYHEGVEAQVSIDTSSLSGYSGGRSVAACGFIAGSQVAGTCEFLNQQSPGIYSGRITIRSHTVGPQQLYLSTTTNVYSTATQQWVNLVSQSPAIGVDVATTVPTIGTLAYIDMEYRVVGSPDNRVYIDASPRMEAQRWAMEPRSDSWPILSPRGNLMSVNTSFEYSDGVMREPSKFFWPTPGMKWLKKKYAGLKDAAGNWLIMPVESPAIQLEAVPLKTRTTVSSTPAVLEAGQAATFKATVGAFYTPSFGAVEFRQGSTVLGTVNIPCNTAGILIGGDYTINVSVSATPGDAGDAAVEARYLGYSGASCPGWGIPTAHFSPSSGVLATTIAKARTTTTLAASPTVVVSGSYVSVKATVLGATPTGLVTFYKDGVEVGSAGVNSSGVATLSQQLTSATSSTFSYTASYAGDDDNDPSTSSAAQVRVGEDSPAMRWRFEYDADGALTRQEEPTGKATILGYNALKQPSTKQLPLTGATVALGFDKQDNLVSLSDPRSLTTTYGVNGLGETRTVTSPDAGRKQATYDAAGNVSSITDARGKTSTFGYDAANRLTSISYPTGTATTFEYDGGPTPVAPNIGQLTKMTDEAGVTTYAYSVEGQLLSKTQVTGGKTLAIAYGYGSSGTANGKLASLTYPGKARANFGYDAFGRVTSLLINPVNAGGTGTDTAQQTTILSGITYSPTGQITGWTWGDGTPYSLVFDEFDRITSYPLGKETSTGVRRSLVFDDASLIRQMNHVGAGGSQPSLNQTFTYDDLGRLVQATVGTATSYAYQYDLSGNRTSQTVGGTTYPQTIAPSSNRLVKAVDAAGTRSITFDLAGNVTNDVVATYAYTDRGRMASATIGSNTVVYKYNGLEQRVSKTGPTALVPTGAAYFAYDEAGKTLGEYDATLAPAYETVYLGSIPVAVIKYAKSGGKNGTWSNSYSYVYADHAGTPRVIVRNTDHAIQWRWDSSDPFAMSVPNANPSGLGAFGFGLRLPGQVYDAETGNYYNWHRDYSPRIGRYLQSDPIGLAGGVNTYSYGLNDPIANIDPLGLDVFRRNGNEFSQAPTSGDGSWERARTIGDHIVGWDPYVTDRVCDDFRGGGDGWWGQEPPVGSEPRGDGGWDYGWGDFAWDAATTVIPAGKVAGLVGKMIVRLAKSPVHHICTNKNCISIASGGPWTPRFEAMFDKAGMKLDDALNMIPVPGHKGPHPEAYHQAVYDRLARATSGKVGDAYRSALQGELQKIGAEIQKAGTVLNRLVTK
jgi:RHS repeat-associated protein